MSERTERSGDLRGKEIVAFATIGHELEMAANKFWTPYAGEDRVDHSYEYTTSAAGEQLHAILPPEQQNEGPQYSLSITNPSRRLRRAIAEFFPDQPQKAKIIFAVFEPSVAQQACINGVLCRMTDEQEGEEPAVLEFTYTDFQEVADRGGITKKASHMQRLGRAALGFAISMAETNGNLNDLGIEPFGRPPRIWRD